MSLEQNPYKEWSGQLKCNFSHLSMIIVLYVLGGELLIWNLIAVNEYNSSGYGSHVGKH